MKNFIIGTSSVCLIALAIAACQPTQTPSGPAQIDTELTNVLKTAGFTGTVDASVEARLGRPLNPDLVDLGRMIFFDKFGALHGDNTCAGCHAPGAGLGDFESIAIGVDNNDKVGPSRAGPRNQRRTPMVLNNGFYPKLMWNGRFSSASGNPFDNSAGFTFPDPEGASQFPANDPDVKTLLAAQGHIPFTELPEMAGFHGISGTTFATARFQNPGLVALSLPKITKSKIKQFNAGRAGLKINNLTLSVDDPDFAQFDDAHGVAIPPVGPDGTRNYPIRDVVLARFNSNAAYKALFGKSFPPVQTGGPITFPMIGSALAEFEISLTFADAPLDKFARGDVAAMTDAQKRGALLFFGKANCVSCHAVAGQSNEMFSDFDMHNIGVPQISPKFGQGTGNVPFRMANGDFKVQGTYDFGLEDITSNPDDRFKFRTSPLRNLQLHQTFFHNGAFTKLEDAVRFHLDVKSGSAAYDPLKAGVATDLHTVADPTPVLAGVDPKMAAVALTDPEFADLIAFLREGLADPGATVDAMMNLVPPSVPSGLPLQSFERPAP